MSVRATHSLGGRLSLWLAFQTLAGLAAICVAVYIAIALGLEMRQAKTLDEKSTQIDHVLAESGGGGSVEELRHRLDEVLTSHGDLSLILHRPDGSVFYERAPTPGGHATRVQTIHRAASGSDPSALTGQLSLSTADDHGLLARIAAILLAASLIGAGLISAGGYFVVRQGLQPLRALEAQTRRMTAGTLYQRLQISNPPQELAPLVAQFNALLDRLERAYEQLESFNADVAHELCTPLATLIGGTEIALRRERNADALKDILGANLDDLQRLASIVQDMLFLSQADRGALARRGPPASLRDLAQKVAGYHEAPLADASLTLKIQGEHVGSFDALLVERALSNLLANATRYADHGSAIQVDIRADAALVSLQITNIGETISAEHLPHLFDRFYRAEASRSEATDHHGLGLAIVSAVARMHGGAPFVRSVQSETTVGFTMSAQSPLAQKTQGLADSA